MIPSSHFIGISLKNAYFEELFKTLARLNTDMDDFLELRNWRTLHVTIYYLHKILGEDEQISLEKDINRFREEGTIEINIDGLRYFSTGTFTKLCYLETNNVHALKELSYYFSDQYKHADLFDNQLTYIPHITLFKVKKHGLFEKHRKILEELINTQLIKIRDINIFENFNLFAVDSGTSPEKQLIVV